MELSKIKKAYEQARKKKEPWLTEMDDAFALTFPQASLYRNPNENVDRSLMYDATASEAVNVLVSNIISFLLPLDAQWAQIDLTDEQKHLNITPTDVAVTLERQNDILFEKIHEGNFYVSIVEAVRNCVVCGTGAICGKLNTDNVLNFTSVPVQQLYFLENGSGIIDTVFRLHFLPARDVIARYENIPDWIREKHDDNPNELIEVIEYQIPDGTDYEYGVVIVKDWHPVFEKQIDFPYFVVFRWEKLTGDAWGFSPVRQLLPDLKVANKLVEIHLDAAEFAALGAWTTSDEMLRNRTLVPGGIMVTSDELRPVQFPGNLNISAQTLQDYRNGIRRNMNADNFPPITEQGTPISATEANLRQAEFIRKIGPAAIRLENELLKPIAMLAVNLLKAVGIMEQVNVDGRTFTINISSAVRKSLELAEAQKDLQLLQLVAQLGPEAVAQIDITKFVRAFLLKTDFSPDLLKPESQARQDLQAQQLQQLSNNLLDKTDPDTLSRAIESVRGGRQQT